MIDRQTVFDKLIELTEYSEDEQSVFMPYCETAAAVISEKMKADADASDIRLVTAAAAMAYSRYIVVRNAADSEFDSLKAGDITVSSSDETAVKAAEQLMLAALTDAAPLLVDSSFSFGTV